MVLLFGRGLGLRKVADLRREEIFRRELDAAEHFARTVRRSGAFLFRNAEVVGRNQQRYVAHELHNRKKPDRRVHGVVAAVVEFSSVKLAYAGILLQMSQPCGGRSQIFAESPIGSETWQVAFGRTFPVVVSMSGSQEQPEVNIFTLPSLP